MKCNRCGTDNPQESRFCCGCGIPMNFNNQQSTMSYQNSNIIQPNNFGQYSNYSQTNIGYNQNQMYGQYSNVIAPVKLKRSEFISEKLKVHNIGMIITWILSLLAGLITLISVVTMRGNFYGFIDVALIMILGTVVFLTKSRICSLIYAGYGCFAFFYPLIINNRFEVQYALVFIVSIICVIVSFIIGSAWRKYNKIG